MWKSIKTQFLFAFSILLLVGCTDPYALQTNTLEDLLVVEATITNETKRQEIILSRTRRLEETESKFEKEAIVYITDNLGNLYEFEEVDNKYLSKQPFQAVPNRAYQLFITTANGISYNSNQQELTKVNEIESINTRVVTQNNTKGVEITISHSDPSNNSHYYRYTYEETAKVTAPRWSPYKIRLVEPVPLGMLGDALIVLDQRTEEAQTCFTTKKSDKIFVNSTNQMSEDKVTHFPLRFINYKDYTIAERYSINVNLYTQNLESYTYHNTLKNLSDEGNLLSPNQPGFIQGNISSSTNTNYKTLGYFEVSSVSSKRIFFNYFDIFPEELTAPDYFDACTFIDYQAYNYDPPPRDAGGSAPALELRRRVRTGELLYYEKFWDNGFLIFRMVKTICGDCSTFSNNVRPSFWID